MKKVCFLKESEYRLLELIRQNEPAALGELRTLTGDLLGWRRTQTAEILRGLIDKGFCVRSGRTVSTAITQEQVENIENGGIAEFIGVRFAGADKTDEE